MVICKYIKIIYYKLLFERRYNHYDSKRLLTDLVFVDFGKLSQNQKLNFEFISVYGPNLSKKVNFRFFLSRLSKAGIVFKKIDIKSKL